MKLDKEKLLVAVRNGIVHARSIQVDWDRRVDEAEAQWEITWREKKLPQWREFRDKLTKALRDGSHVTEEDLPISLSSYSEDRKRNPLYRPFNRGRWVTRYQGSKPEWVATHNLGPRPVDQVGKFEVLIDFLETINDSEVTTGQLQSAGFRNLEKLFTAATHGYWED